MKINLISALFFCVTVCACQHVGFFWKGDIDGPGRKKVLNADSSGTLFVTTHHTNGQVGLTVWQVLFQSRYSKKVRTLFSVERVLDEPTPGMPLYGLSEGRAIIHDKTNSYIYDLNSKDFRRNQNPEAVYSGSYQSYGRPVSPEERR